MLSLFQYTKLPKAITRHLRHRGLRSFGRMGFEWRFWYQIFRWESNVLRRKWRRIEITRSWKLFRSKGQFFRRLFIAEVVRVSNFNELGNIQLNVIQLIFKLLLRGWMWERRCGIFLSFRKAAVCSFSSNFLLQLLLLILQLAFYNWLLPFSAMLTAFEKLFDLCVWMKLHFFQLLFVFLFFKKKSSSFTL